MSRITRLIAVLVGAVLALALGATATYATAAPTWDPRIEVFLADGVTPVGDTLLHPGDELVVKGYGFDPEANRDGLPVPVPPGVPHGTFVAFGPFEPDWRPSQGAPEESRPTNRMAVKWALSPRALAQVPSVPFDMNRTVRQRWIPLHDDGTFTARITATTPKTVPADGRWGVYTYGGASSKNPAQELYVPINYTTAAGPNTPVPAPKNLVWGYSPSFHEQVTGDLQGNMYGSDGAGVTESGDLTYTLTTNTIRNGAGELRFTGTVVAYTRFNLAEIALADPILRIDGGKGVLSMRTSTTNMNGTDALRRIDIADVTLTEAQVAELAAGGDVSGLPTGFRPGISPEILAAASLGPAAPLTLDLGAR